MKARTYLLASLLLLVAPTATTAGPAAGATTAGVATAGAVPAGATPTGATPTGATPTGRSAAVILQSTEAGRPGQHPTGREAGDTQGGDTQGGDTQGGDMQGGDTQAGPGVEPAAPDGVGPAPDTLMPGATPVVPHAARPPAAATGPAETYRVLATREGLVGHTTANGHKIVDADHFVSLPSWDSLAPKGGNDYSVRVCAVGNGRCVYEPVWDVGPWNTGDTYWAAHRGDWPSLARGVPEAQAAYQDGFHQGKDQFGRTVVNPAGIDLADGAIRDGLGYASSAWVTVTYLWTGGGRRGSVDADGSVLHVRSGPSTATPIAGLAGPYAQLPIGCRITGQSITRSAGTSTRRWYRVGPGNYVSAAYVTVPAGTRSKIKIC